MADARSSRRLDGLDLARFLAFVGMVIVNFKIAMGAGEDGGLLGFLTAALEGRAAASFVVLAGIGLGLAAKRAEHAQTVSVTLERAAFMLVLGLLDTVISTPTSCITALSIFYSASGSCHSRRGGWCLAASC